MDQEQSLQAPKERPKTSDNFSEVSDGEVTEVRLKDFWETKGIYMGKSVELNKILAAKSGKFKQTYYYESHLQRLPG